MSKELEYGLTSIALTATPTDATTVHNTINCRVDGSVTYTEKDYLGVSTVYTEEMTAGMTFYGVFTVLSASGGHIVAGR